MDTTFGACSRRGNGVRGVPGVRRVIYDRCSMGSSYLLKTGCQWRMVPREFGKWNTIYSLFQELATEGGVGAN